MPLYAPYARRLRRLWRIDQYGEGVVVSIATVDRSYFELNGGVLYRFPIDSDDVSPFAMGGLNIARVKVEGEGVGPGGSGSRTDTDLGLNLGGGVTFLTGEVRPSVGLKIELSGGEGFVIFGALGFPLG
jgi:hypothetical protein